MFIHHLGVFTVNCGISVLSSLFLPGSLLTLLLCPISPILSSRAPLNILYDFRFLCSGCSGIAFILFFSSLFIHHLGVLTVNSGIFRLSSLFLPGSLRTLFLCPPCPIRSSRAPLNIYDFFFLLSGGRFRFLSGGFRFGTIARGAIAGCAIA